MRLGKSSISVCSSSPPPGLCLLMSGSTRSLVPSPTAVSTPGRVSSPSSSSPPPSTPPSWLIVACSSTSTWTRSTVLRGVLSSSQRRETLKYRAQRGVIVQSEKGDIENRAEEKFKDFDEDVDPALAEFERNRREYINAMKRIRLENPDISLINLETKAREEVMAKGPKSRAYYRAQATRKMAGKEEAALAASLEKKDDGVTRIMFDPPHYTVMESVGTFEVTVVREGGDLNQTVQVDYKTEDGSASSEGDYIEAIGTLTFGPGETQKMVTLEVLDDDVFEEDEHFYIRISNLRRKDGKPFKEIEVEGEDVRRSMQASCQMGTPHMATIMILDDDHSGIFGFEDSEAEIVESVGTYELEVKRISGARGKVAIPYNTEDGTAKEGTHYEAQEGELMYENEETTKTISIAITDEESYEKNL